MLRAHLKYVFLEGEVKKLVIIHNSLSRIEEQKLVEVLNANHGDMGWHVFDLKEISPAYSMHKIKLEKDYKPIAQSQRRLNRLWMK